VARTVWCPRDGTEARTEEHDGHHGRFRLDVCGTCGGVWFDKGEITKLTDDRDLEHLIVTYASGESRLECPGCGAGMAQRPVGGVVRDVCTSCRGVWMDRGELEDAAQTLGHPPPPEIAPEHVTKDLAIRTWTSPNTREALLMAASREGFRGP